MFNPFVFYPALGHIKETMTVQIISFACLVVLLLEFEADFMFNKGLLYSINWFGKGQYSQLVGVILFNYAFVITVPAWLAEKTTDTRINQTMWTASIFSSFLYISFGILAAFAFEDCSESMLTLLASNEVALPTRICAALFGLTIVGAGVPVFCVIVKNTLYSTKTCNAHWSFFIGSVLPYSTSWCLYKGTLLMDVLNWAGLVVNGVAAFCLPLVLCWWFYSGRSKLPLRATIGGEVELSAPVSMQTYQYHSTDCENGGVGKETELENEEGDMIEAALPDCLIPYRLSIIALMVVIFATAITSSIVIDIIMGVGPS